MSVSAIIKEILKNKNITQQNLAEKINTTKQNLSNKLNRDNFTTAELVEIAKALEMQLQLVDIDKAAEIKKEIKNINLYIIEDCKKAGEKKRMAYKVNLNILVHFLEENRMSPEIILKKKWISDTAIEQLKISNLNKDDLTSSLIEYRAKFGKDFIYTASNKIIEEISQVLKCERKTLSDNGIEIKE